MAFGQQSGPPASAREVAQLEALLGEAGYSSFREARHIYGLTQRQAAGRFTRTEAAELLERLTRGEGELDAETADADRLADYQPFHAARADLLARAGRADEAVAAYDRALELTTNPAERGFLERQRAAVRPH